MRTYLVDLAVGDRFSHDENGQVWVVTGKRTMDNLTRIDYKADFDSAVFENTWTTYNFSTVWSV